MRAKNYLPKVAVRLIKDGEIYSEKEIHNKYDAIEIVGKELAEYDRELFCVLNLKSNGAVINMHIVSMGALNASIVSPREVFKTAILSNAAYCICIHNHPSGAATPSIEDKMTTKRLVEGGKLLDIPVIDHLIVAADSNVIFSFAENGLINPEV